MKREFTPEALVTIPILTASTAIALCTRIRTVAAAEQSRLAAAGQSLPTAIADALEDLDRALQALSLVKQPVVTDPTAKMRADTRLDSAWRNLYNTLSGWSDTPPEFNPDPGGTGALMAVLFPDGLRFLKARYHVEWSASKSRLDALASQASYGQTISVLGLQPLLQMVQNAQVDYGAALAITEPAPPTDPTAVRDALADLCARLRVYILQVAAYACTRAVDAKPLADALLEPIAAWVSPEPPKGSTPSSG